MDKKQKKILSMTLALGVLTGTYIPITSTALAETEKESIKKSSAKTSPQMDSRAWINNPYQGVSMGQFLNAFNGNQWKPLLEQIHNKGDAGSGTIAFLKGMMTTGLSLLPPPGSLLASVWDIFIPGTGVKDDMWLQIEKYVDEKIDSKINDYHKYLMGAQFNGAMEKVKEYQRVLQIYNNSKVSVKVEEPEAPVRDAVRKADSELASYIAVIQTPEKETDSVYQQITAPIFVQAANLHLLVLRDIIQFGEEWGIDKDQLKGYKDKQEKLIENYTDYSIKVYNDGLEKRINEADKIFGPEDGYGNPAKPGPEEAYTNTHRWNYINEYIREYTLSVLDFVALFPSTNPNIYSRGAMQKNSRQIYSSISGTVTPNTQTWKDINNRLASQEYKGELVAAEVQSYARIDALAPWFDRNSGTTYNTGWVGNTSGGILRKITIDYSNPLTKVNIGDQRTPFYFQLTHENGSAIPQFGQDDPRLKKRTFEFPNQKISDIQAFGKSTAPGLDGIDAVVFGFTDRNLDSKHDLMRNMISSIPAEMYQGKSNFKPQMEPINAQQKAMKTDTTNSYLTYKVNSYKAQEYKIRYRVAANENSKISISQKSGTNFEKIGDTNISKTVNAEDTVKGEYGYYKIIEGPTVKLNYGQNELKLENTQGKFAIDRIELEPIQKDEIVFEDNFDGTNKGWIFYSGGGIVGGGVTGRAGMIPSGTNSIVYPSGIDYYSKYTLNMKVKLQSTDPNIKQKVKIYHTTTKGQMVSKEVELKGGEGYKELKLEFITGYTPSESNQIGIQSAVGGSNVLFDDVKLTGAKR
ncbi:hypothetical protein COL26_30830 [Bacillus thuringiensis]|uniref:Crystaline entomocidal protoxin n=1 Tax=Bacillus thuringiensis TaxID=1428 RepID=A0ABD6S854_BACTU|nr:insecticidal delta-endotoxin Cry8Ea1 family protein [Bacillus thuringiensis]PER47848.1 hypothetical protein CN495_24680 [Bacillus thuringiensis]PEU87494.1 hypothetical protein CN411_14105 [Bacillus thuringiensis]PFH98355.1 hypothetical protein COI79_33465 [Bacillus thuringiensis]PFW25052.1 hypothetical protein COL26_30830 [Bacillus thuringiensis]PGY66907.1 hypothetical protein COE44_28415 [Bacillus thuringiensis]